MFLEEETLLKHNLDCMQDNKMRLKQVKNLEELINFKIKTVVSSETVDHSKSSLLRDVETLLSDQRVATIQQQVGG